MWQTIKPWHGRFLWTRKPRHGRFLQPSCVLGEVGSTQDLGEGAARPHSTTSHPQSSIMTFLLGLAVKHRCQWSDWEIRPNSVPGAQTNSRKRSKLSPGAWTRGEGSRIQLSMCGTGEVSPPATLRDSQQSSKDLFAVGNNRMNKFR